MLQTNRRILQYFKCSLTKIRTIKCQQIRCVSMAEFLNPEKNDIEYEEPGRLMSEIMQFKDFDRARKVFVVMPRQKRGPNVLKRDKATFLMDETKTLIESIQGWEVVDSRMISTASINSRRIFGSTNLKNLHDDIRKSGADTVVFSLDSIRPMQHQFFEENFHRDVFDRFSVVLNIFRERSKTKEAKLQLALAELNYIRRNLHHLGECNFQNFHIAQSYGGKFDTFYQVKKQLITDMMAAIKKKLEKIERDNQIQKQNRVKMQIPTVAVVGYTNSGKTSLIKALTLDKKLQPEDRLFATLSATVHETNLPSTNMKTLFVDTIGFITEMPTTLIHCFKTTLSEICTADLIVHVTDVNHPDYELQVHTVKETLREINVPEKLIETMIQVENKVDMLDDLRLEEFFQKNDNSLFISATERIGLKELTQTVEEKLIQNTERIRFKIRVPNGGEKYQWLKCQTTVAGCVPDPNNDNLMILDVIMTQQEIGKFKKLFD